MMVMTIQVMTLIMTTRMIGANMKKNIAKKCDVCKAANVKFMQNGLGYCGISSVLGSMNMFGFCKAKKRESPELKKYIQAHAIYQGQLWFRHGISPTREISWTGVRFPSAPPIQEINMTKTEVIAAINVHMDEMELEDLVRILDVLNMTEEDIAKEEEATAYLNSLPNDLVSN